MKLIVLGGGPAGVMAALRAHELGAPVTLIESKRLGGTDLNEGPAMVRTLARAARLMRGTHSWSLFGLKGKHPEIDLLAALANARRVANYAYEQKHIVENLRNAGIEVIEGVGPAQFLDQYTVGIADGRTWQAGRIIIAVGGSGRKLPIPGADMALTYSDIGTLQHLPSRVAVIGGAATGCQLASILEDFGCQVHLIEFASRLNPQGDEDISDALAAAFRQQGIDVLTNTSTDRLERGQGGIQLHYSKDAQPASLEVDAVFCAMGWPGNVGALNLPSANVVTERSYVPVNDYLQSNVPHIYAAGDINGQSMLVQSAMHEGRIAAENAVLGPHRKFTHEVVPYGSFTDPEYAGVGLTEPQARAQYDCAVAVVRYDNLLRPVADGHPDGFCKLIVERRYRLILGAHVLGEYSAEVIQMVAACMAAGMRVEQLAELQLAHPTVTEAIGIAAQKLTRELGLMPMAPSWDSIEAFSIR